MKNTKTTKTLAALVGLLALAGTSQPVEAAARRRTPPTSVPANSRIDAQTGHRVYRSPSGRYEDRVVASGNLCSIPGQRASAGLDCIDLPGGARWQVPGSRLNPIRFGQTYSFTQRQSNDDSFVNTWTMRIDGTTPEVTASVLAASGGGSSIEPQAPLAGNQWMGVQATLNMVSGTTQPNYFAIATGRLLDGNDQAHPRSVIWRNARPAGEIDYSMAAAPAVPTTGRLTLELPSAVAARQVPMADALRTGLRDEVLLHIRWFPAPGQLTDTYFSVNP